MYSADPKKLKRLTENPFLRNTVDIWYKAHQHIGDTPSISRFSSIWGNTYFKAGRTDGRLKFWADNGAQKIRTFIWMVILTFDQMCQAYHIPRKRFFKYLQLKHFILSKRNCSN